MKIIPVIYEIVLQIGQFVQGEKFHSSLQLSNRKMIRLKILVSFIIIIRVQKL